MKYKKYIRSFSLCLLLIVAFSLYQNFSATNQFKNRLIKISNLYSYELQNAEKYVFNDKINSELYRRYETNKQQFNPAKIYSTNKRNLKNDYYLILEYTKVFGQTKYCQKQIDSDQLGKFQNLELLLKNADKKNSENYNLLTNCAYTNCFFTCNKSLASQSDALIFHDTKSLSIDFERKPSQVFIYWNDEANYIDKNLDMFYFNWTISYKYESEASYCSYGCHIKKNKEKNYFLKKIQKEFKTRKNSSIWFVSNCNARYRISFSVSLGNKFPVKIFGNCLNKITSMFKVNSKFISFNNNNNLSCGRRSACEINELNSNKFFLAFENSNCSGYITEKFWRSLYYGIIPVVIQPSKQFYENIAPKDSFIHASDFNFNANKLADYLYKVSTDFKLYLKHLKWKLEYEAYYETEVLEQNRICELCYKLNTDNSISYYNSISSYYNTNCSKN
jgi:hypothetical protein